MTARRAAQLVTIAFLLGAAQGALGAQDKEQDPLLERALHLLKEDVGEWESRWDFLDAQGNVVRSMEGVESMRFIIEDRVLEVTTKAPSRGLFSKSWRFFHPVQRRLVFTSVDRSGDLWILTEEVGSGVMMSHAHPLADGRTMQIRFTVVQRKADSMVVTREDSFDSGQTWRLQVRQHLRRK